MNSVDSLSDRCVACGGRTVAALCDVFDVRFGIDALYDIRSCQNCGMEQLQPMPGIDQLTGYYNAYYNLGGMRGSTYATARESFLYSGLYRAWLFLDGDPSFHSLQGSGRLLDIGCNEGRGLLFFRKNGFNAEGLELNDVAAAMARSKGFVVYSGNLDDFHPSQPYDVAVLSNVLEHSLDPRKMLSNVFGVLRPGGEVRISCPNSLSWLRRLFGRHWINWHVPFHVVHFSGNSLRRLLRESGFEVIDVRQETPALWVAYSLIARLFSRYAKVTAQLRNPLLVAGLMLLIRGTLFPLLWLGNKLGRGDCLVVRGRKT